MLRVPSRLRRAKNGAAESLSVREDAGSLRWPAPGGNQEGEKRDWVKQGPSGVVYRGSGLVVVVVVVVVRTEWRQKEQLGRTGMD